MDQSLNRVYWITGLSGSGKSTLCNNLVDHLREQGETIVKLDGDDLREIMDATDVFDRKSRMGLAMRYSKLCRLLSSQGVNVAISTISLFHDVQNWNRENIAGYIEIFLDVPLEILKRRDPKKIYARAERGELKHVAGVDLEIERPENSDFVLKYEPDKGPGKVLEELLTKLNNHSI